MTKSTTSSEKNGLKKGPWTPEEDHILVDYIQKHGYGKWRTLPKNAGLKRCGKSCRLRWANYLRPDIKRGRFSLEEEEAIIQLHSTLGNKWSTIAANLPGRTDNEIKNYWNTHIKKKLLKMGIDPVTHTPRLDVLQLASILNSSLFNSPQNQINNSDIFGIGRGVNPNQLQLLNLFTTLLSCQSKNQDISISNNNFQQNQIFSNPLLQNQSQCSQPMQQLIQTFQSNQPNLSVQENNLESEIIVQQQQQHQSSLIATPFSHQNSTLQNLWQSLLLDQEQPETSSSAAMNNLLGSQILCNNNEGMQNFNSSSLLLSAPSSSNPSALNSPSSTTFFNGTTEDERDTYGLSDTLDFCD